MGMWSRAILSIESLSRDGCQMWRAIRNLKNGARNVENVDVGNLFSACLMENRGFLCFPVSDNLQFQLTAP